MEEDRPTAPLRRRLRCPTCNQSLPLSIAQVLVDTEGRTFVANDRTFHLSPTGAKIFRMLLAVAPTPIPINVIAEELWGRKTVNAGKLNTLRVHICIMRKQVRRAGLIIASTYGQGYRLLLKTREGYEEGRKNAQPLAAAHDS